jgi:hypothetical protein
MFYLVRFTERNPEGRTLREQHNGSIAWFPFSFAQVMWIPQVLNERAIVGNGRLHLLEAHTQSVPCLAQTGNMLRKLALDLLYLPFECLDSLVCLIGELLGRLQKQLPKLAFIQVELLHQLLVFTSPATEPRMALRRSVLWTAPSSRV